MFTYELIQSVLTKTDQLSVLECAMQLGVMLHTASEEEVQACLECANLLDTYSERVVKQQDKLQAHAARDTMKAHLAKDVELLKAIRSAIQASGKGSCKLTFNLVGQTVQIGNPYFYTRKADSTGTQPAQPATKEEKAIMAKVERTSSKELPSIEEMPPEKRVAILKELREKGVLAKVLA